MKNIKQILLTAFLLSLFAFNISAQHQKLKINSPAIESKSSNDKSVRSQIIHQPLSIETDTAKTAKWNKRLYFF